MEEKVQDLDWMNIWEGGGTMFRCCEEVDDEDKESSAQNATVKKRERDAKMLVSNK